MVAVPVSVAYIWLYVGLADVILAIEDNEHTHTFVTIIGLVFLKANNVDEVTSNRIY